MGAAQNRALGTGKARNGLMPAHSKAVTGRGRREGDERRVCYAYPRTLDVTGPRTFTGAGQGGTIIEAGSGSSTAIARVFSLNPVVRVPASPSR